MNSPSILVRPARAEDQRAITRIVRAARINPFDLPWQRFLVAEIDGQIAGVAQVRRHGDGSRELASVATEPAFQRRGAASALIRAWLEHERGPLYLTCRAHMEPFYERFQFRRAETDLPAHLARIRWFMRLGGGLVMVRGAGATGVGTLTDAAASSDADAKASIAAQDGQGQALPLPKGRLLGVFAHPDDETFGAGGTLALYARRGVATHVVCATRGEVGDAPDGLNGHASVGEMREAELRCASDILGLTSVRYLDYRDSGMPGSEHNEHPASTVSAPREEVARKIAWHIRDIRPQVVITFDEIGGYLHPDHVAVHEATVAAFRMAGDPAVEIEGTAPYAPQKLYAQAIPRVWIKFGIRLLQLFRKDPSRFGRNGDIDLVALVPHDFPIHASIDTRSVARIKEQASACHASQGGFAMPAPLRWLARTIGSREEYTQLIPETGPARRERDLFEGVRGEWAAGVLAHAGPHNASRSTR